MSLKLTAGDFTIHRVIEQETTFCRPRHAARPDAGTARSAPAVDARRESARR
jgi:hypothetical protein